MSKSISSFRLEKKFNFPFVGSTVFSYLLTFICGDKVPRKKSVPVPSFPALPFRTSKDMTGKVCRHFLNWKRRSNKGQLHLYLQNPMMYCY